MREAIPPSRPQWHGDRVRTLYGKRSALARTERIAIAVSHQTLSNFHYIEIIFGMQILLRRKRTTSPLQKSAG
jgi:hypothetical protein